MATPPAAPPTAATAAAPKTAGTATVRMPAAASGGQTTNQTARDKVAERLGAFTQKEGEPAKPSAPSPGSQQKTPEQMRKDRITEYDKKRAEGTKGPKEAAGDRIAEAAKTGTEAEPNEAKVAKEEKTGTVVETGKEPAEGGTQNLEDGFPTIEAARNMKSGELSRHYKNLKQKLATVLGENTKLKKGVEANPEFSKLQETHKQATERLAAVEQELRYTNYERSNEYQEQYWKPYESAYQNGADKISKLRVMEVKDELYEVTSAARKGTFEDFERLMSIGDDADAADFAGKLFGPAASVALLHREKVLELNSAKENAKEKFKKEGGEIMAKRQEQWTQQQAETSKTYTSEIERHTKEHPEWYGEVEGDDEATKRWKFGADWADAAFSGVVKNSDGSERKLNPQELAKRHALMRNKAAAFDKLTYQLKGQQTLVKELQAKLKAFEESEPGEGDGGKGGGGERVDDGGTSKESIRSRITRFVT